MSMRSFGSSSPKLEGPRKKSKMNGGKIDMILGATEIGES